MSDASLPEPVRRPDRSLILTQAGHRIFNLRAPGSPGWTDLPAAGRFRAAPAFVSLHQPAAFDRVFDEFDGLFPRIGFSVGDDDLAEGSGGGKRTIFEQPLHAG